MLPAALNKLKSTVSIQYLKIEAYSDPKFESKIGDPFIAQFNPDSIKHDMNIKYGSSQASGSSGKEPAYKFSSPEQLSFNLEFSKGVDLSKLMSGDKEFNQTVIKRVETLKSTIYTFNGSNHEPNFTILSWGDFMFKGRCTSLNVKYGNYDITGEPMRASISLAFVKSIDPETRAKEEERTSPDLTHYIEIKEGDTLPALCHKIYGNPAYYFEVAKINNLKNFRKIEPGIKLLFPPIEK